MSFLRFLLQPGWIAGAFIAAVAAVVYYTPSAPMHDGMHRSLAAASSLSFPDLPLVLAPGVPGDRVRVSLLSSPGHVAQVRALVDPAAVVLDEGAALARMDGTVWGSDVGAVRSLLGRLGWQNLPVDLTQTDADAALIRAAERTRFPVPRRAHFAAFGALRSARDLANAHVLVAMSLLAAVAAFACWRIVGLVGTSQRRNASHHSAEASSQPEWRAPAARPDVKVVLVESRPALDAVRTAIGEEHILASGRDAFAFAHGWILAVRDETIWQLLSELGWSDRRLRLWEPGDEMGANTEAVIRGASRDRGRAEPLSVIEALHMAGPIAHG